MKIAFLFSGQGAQKPGMAQSLYRDTQAAHDIFDLMSEAMDVDLARLCFDSDQDTLNQTENTQPAMLAADLAAMAALAEKGVKPAFCAGFSLGEYAALACCGAQDAAGAAKLVAARAACMAKCQGGVMAAILGMDAARLEEICAGISAGYIAPVNYNCPGQTVVAGDQQGLDALKEALQGEKARVTPLKVSGAFHSRLMIPAGREFRPTLDAATFKTAEIPIVCNATAEPFDDSEQSWPDMLERQLCSPVRWEQSVHRLVALGAEAFIECGPGRVLAKLNKRICPDIPTYAVEDTATLEDAVRALAL